MEISSRNKELSFLAARYLRHALKLCLRGNDLFHIVKIWHSYMEFATEDPDAIEWDNMNECFGSLPKDELRVAFVPPKRFGKFAFVVTS